MAFGVHPDRLGTREHEPHRSPAEPRRERCVGLDRQIFLAAEGAAVGHQLDPDRVEVHCEHRRDLALIVVDPLTLRVDRQTSVSGYRQARLGFQECMFDPLGLKPLLDDVSRAGKCALDVAP